ncbi:hypothetical protein TREMEDRAFT_70373 [Tremella mesenterica DSM 1558]|uniref:uncharacterized protein n=1 Tax=Tremella mesenterica (strain ATCC 24925 / CBS 8224 / DSM 1558 / NBRC 9311 / NRRL Y-6157 / RJB 2259-6 / UBC 559-6) TaxID=578456 RepID=UPI00032BB6CA|nr:uncharacterized protein TREMEDRAFT_70373 [Tremella mesenterica DSM 1558]EIW65955.1 hypothetical protein TREMEDRAFT_70373 [Tremella mesenterica DSM 1558]
MSTPTSAKIKIHTAISDAIPVAWKIDTSDLPLNVSNYALTCGILTQEEIKIVQYDALGLRDLIAARQLSAVEVITAFGKSAAIAHQTTNCLTAYFFQEGLERAKWLDAEMERTGKPVGPLHGVPVSVKDTVPLRGHRGCSGFAAWTENSEAGEDGTLVSVLRAAGAVFYVKTIVPQAVMQLETDSFLGPCVNPYNTRLTAGGSSGGEGALICAKGSVLGIGTDVGGSIRSPAANNGLFGFKPTSFRLPMTGGRDLMAGQETIPASIGPLASSSRDVDLFVRVILDAKTWEYDMTTVAMPWRPEEVVWKGGSKPIIGVMWDDGVVRPQPPMSNTLAYAVEKLEKAGFRVVNYEPFRQAEGWELITKLYHIDGGERLQDVLQSANETIHPLTEWLVNQSKSLTISELMELTVQRDAFREAYAAHFVSSNIDLILCPPSPGPAPLCGTSRYWSYTSFFNLVDYPAAVFPTGLHVTLDDKADNRYKLTCRQDKEVWEAYSPEVFLNAPLSLQVAAPRWQDEKVVLGMKMIEEVVRS